MRVTLELREIVIRSALQGGLSERDCALAFGVSRWHVRQIKGDLSELAVHHIDGNPRNNGVENLRLVLIREDA